MDVSRVIKLSTYSLLALLWACSPSTPSAPSVSLTPSPLNSPPPPIPTPSVKPQAVKTFEDRLRVDVAQKAEIAVQKVDCPNQVAVAATIPFDCQVTAEGKTFVVAVNPKSNSRELQWSTNGLLVLPKLERTIQQGIRTQFRLSVKTNCGGKVRVAKPGDAFQCRITDDRGQTRAVTVRVDDAKGNVTWKL